MADVIIIAILVIVLGLAAGYVVREKKRGRKCIGCPESGCANCSCHRK